MHLTFIKPGASSLKGLDCTGSVVFLFGQTCTLVTPLPSYRSILGSSSFSSLFAFYLQTQYSFLRLCRWHPFLRPSERQWKRAGYVRWWRCFSVASTNVSLSSLWVRSKSLSVMLPSGHISKNFSASTLAVTLRRVYVHLVHPVWTLENGL